LLFKEDIVVVFQTKESLLKVEHVVGVGERFGRTRVFVDKYITPEQNNKVIENVRGILETVSSKHDVTFKCIGKEMTLFNHVGATVSGVLPNNKPFIGTLGCFAFKISHNKTEKKAVCAIVSKHVAMLASEKSPLVLGKCNQTKDIHGTLLKTLDRHMYDIAAIEIKEADRYHFCPKFTNDQGKELATCSLYDHETSVARGQYLVYIWGAKSKPGLGEIDADHFFVDGCEHIILIQNRSKPETTFCEAGDSGAIVLAKRRNGDCAMGMVIGAYEAAGGKTDKQRYGALLLKPGLEQLGEENKCKLLLCTDSMSSE